LSSLFFSSTFFEENWNWINYFFHTFAGVIFRRFVLVVFIFVEIVLELFSWIKVAEKKINNKILKLVNLFSRPIKTINILLSFIFLQLLLLYRKLYYYFTKLFSLKLKNESIVKIRRKEEKLTEGLKLINLFNSFFFVQFIFLIYL
jgi:hypothetical protein